MKIDPKTISVYDRRHQDYKNMKKSESENQLLQKFAIKLPNNGTVLDYGCGPGDSAAYFATCGLISHAFDASIEMVKIANKQKGVRAWQSSFDDFRSENIYDGIWANFSLLHAERKDMPNLLSCIHKGLKLRGLFHIAMKLGYGSARDKIGRQYTYFEKNELDELLQSAGFTTKSHLIGELTGLDGTRSKWIAILSHA